MENKTKIIYLQCAESV